MIRSLGNRIFQPWILVAREQVADARGAARLLALLTALVRARERRGERAEIQELVYGAAGTTLVAALLGRWPLVPSLSVSFCFASCCSFSSCCSSSVSS